MNTSTTPSVVIASLPAAGASSTSLRWLATAAARRGVDYVGLANPKFVDEFQSGRWQRECVQRLREVVATAGSVVLVGHSMGGLAAVLLAGDGRLGVPVGVLALNTPCPDAQGRIPTMSVSSDAEIAAILISDGFPADILDDEDVLAEIAEDVRSDAVMADRLALAVHAAGAVPAMRAMHVLATSGDRFIGLERCVEWRHRVSGEFHLVVGQGGHMLTETPVGTLERAVDSAIAATLGA